MLKKIIAFCGGQNKYASVQIGADSHAELTATIRTNIQEIANSNEKLELLGYMFGKWLTKRSSIYFLTGLSKALMEG